MSQSKVKVYNVTLDGVIIHYRLYIIDIPNAIDTTEYYSSIPSHSLAVCTSQTTLGDRSLIQQGGEAFVREFGASTQAEEVFVDNR